MSEGMSLPAASKAGDAESTVAEQAGGKMRRAGHGEHFTSKLPKTQACVTIWTNGTRLMRTSVGALGDQWGFTKLVPPMEWIPEGPLRGGAVVGILGLIATPIPMFS